MKSPFAHSPLPLPYVAPFLVVKDLLVNDYLRYSNKHYRKIKSREIPSAVFSSTIGPPLPRGAERTHSSHCNSDEQIPVILMELPI